MRFKKRCIFIGFIIVISLFTIGCEEVNKTAEKDNANVKETAQISDSKNKNESTQAKKELLQFVQSKELDAILNKTRRLSEEIVLVRQSQESYTNINDFKKDTEIKWREYINHQEEVYNEIYEVDFKSPEMNKLKYEILSLLNSSREQFELSVGLLLNEELELENKYSKETLELYANAQ